MLGRRWGARILIVSPLCSLVSFLFINNLDIYFLAYFIGVYCIPLFLSGLGFLYLTHESKK